jgi:hypothetical protein
MIIFVVLILQKYKLNNSISSYFCLKYKRDCGMAPTWVSQGVAQNVTCTIRFTSKQGTAIYIQMIRKYWRSQWPLVSRARVTLSQGSRVRIPLGGMYKRVCPGSFVFMSSCACTGLATGRSSDGVLPKCLQTLPNRETGDLGPHCSLVSYKRSARILQIGY